MEQDYDKLEHGGWMAQAGTYDEYFAPVTRQAIPAILASFAELAGRKLLDAACGTGHLAAAAAERGALATGLDFAAAMLERARANFPELAFREGDLRRLPFADRSFDLMACAFGMHHLELPQSGFSEAHRVIRPGGRFSFTVWGGAEQGHGFLAVVQEALAAHGKPERHPPGPAPLRFGSPGGGEVLLAGAGFHDIEVRILSLEWRARRAEDALDMIRHSMVRVPMLISAQEPAARERIQAVIVQGLRRYEDGDGIRVPFPALLVSAVKPGAG